MWSSVIAFIASFAGTAALTKWVRVWAIKLNAIDEPNDTRKIHLVSTPLLGGAAIFLVFSFVVLICASLTNYLIGKSVGWLEIIAILVGGLIIMFGGYLDDRYNLKPSRQIIWPVLAAVAVMLAGVRAQSISNPFGGFIELGATAGFLISFIWLMGMMYTTKLLDGLDGLATGIGAIGGLIIFGLTQFTPFYEPPVGLLAIILAGACLGFLIWNWHPAKIFLGEGGSLYIGFILGVLAIISGAKIATTLLVMGVPILDVAWVIIRRLFWDHKNFSVADRKHLHYRLLDIGLSQRQAVAVLYFITASFGIVALFLGTQGKLIALFALFIVMILLGTWIVWRYKVKQKRSQH